MAITERQREIMDWLEQDGTLSTEQLAERFAVSSQTIRRDINELSELGLARRQHGGLRLPSQQYNQSFQQRSSAQLELKQAIARRVVGALPAHATVFLGYGTTVEQVARALPNELPLRVVTNNLQAVASLMHKPMVETWVAGGKLRHQDQDVAGSVTLKFLQGFKADIAICGVGGIDADGGLFEFQPEEAELTRVLLDNCRQRVLVADHSKFLRAAPARVGRLDEIDAFYTDAASAALRALCLGAGVELHEG